MFERRSSDLRVYSAETLPQVVHVKNILEHAGIVSEVRNENLGSVMGEVPFFAVWPELWISDRRDLEKATRLVQEVIDAPEPSGPPWQCRQCRAENDYQFSACWQCSAPTDE